MLQPLLYLGAMGLGLGTLVDQHGTAAWARSATWSSSPPGCWPRAPCRPAVGESTYPVLGSVKWNKTYQAAVSSPLRPADLFHGHLLFVALRLTMTSSVFLAVAAAFGAIRSPWAIAGPAGRGAHRAGLRGADRGLDRDPHQGHLASPWCTASG